MTFFSDAFWQQQLRGVNFAGWFVRRKVAIIGSVLSGIIHLLLGILYLLLMQDAWEVRTDVFSNPSGPTAFDIEVPEDVTDVALYVEIPTFFANFRSFTMSRDNRVVGATFQSTKCEEDGRTLDDFMRLRGDTFASFMEGHPLINSAVLKGGGTDELCPCGLNSFSLLLDMFELKRRGKNTPEILDETRVSRSTDIDFVKSDKLESSGAASDTGISGVFNNQVGDIVFNGTTCWLRGNTPTTPEYQQDRAFLRFLSFYRVATSNFLILLLGHYDDLKKGNYTLTATHVDPSWNQWKGATERKAVLSSLSSVGSNFVFVPVLCIVLGVIQLAFAAFFLLVKPKRL